MPPPHESSCLRSSRVSAAVVSFLPNFGPAVMAVFIQATGITRPQGEINWRATITSPVDFERHERGSTLTTGQLKELRAAHPAGSAPFWGTHSAFESAGREIAPGDVVFLTGDAKILAIARVGASFDNGRFADTLWPQHPNRGSYRYVYSLAGINFVELPYGHFVSRGLTLPKFQILGLYQVPDNNAGTFLDAFHAEIAALATSGRGEELEPRDGSGPVGSQLEHGDAAWAGSGVLLEFPPSDETSSSEGAGPSRDARPTLEEPTPGEADIAAHLDGFEGATDIETIARARREQARLRQLLVGGRSVRDGRCGICGRVFPIGLLLAAHVKRRSHCSEEERRDFVNVAMLACALGCDVLFEAGYLTVGSDGRIRTAGASLTHPALHKILGTLRGREAPAWNEHREPYFAWHRDNRFLPGRAVGP